MLRHALVAIGLAALASGQVLYRTEFHNDAGWSFPLPHLGSEWKVDAQPAGVQDGPFRSPPFSLNYNDDTIHYEPVFDRMSYATSPTIDLTAAAGQPVLTFWCNNACQEAPYTCDSHEAYRLGIHSGGAQVLDVCLTCDTCYNGWSEITSPCIPFKWHEHTLLLDKSWGRIEIGFNMFGDGILNDGAGPFVDDLVVADLEAPATYCDAKTNTQGCEAEIEFLGLASLNPNLPFVIRAPNAINQQPGLLFYSTTGPANTPLLGGTLCVQPPLVRTPVVTTGGNPPPADCSGELVFDFSAWIQSGNDPGLVAGTRVYAQFFYRDPSDAFKAGLTDGITFLIHP